MFIKAASAAVEFLLGARERDSLLTEVGPLPQQALRPEGPYAPAGNGNGDAGAEWWKSVSHHDLTDEMLQKISEARRTIQDQAKQMEEMEQQIIELKREKEALAAMVLDQGDVRKDTKSTQSNKDLRALTHDLLHQLEKSKNHSLKLEKQLRHRDREAKAPSTKVDEGTSSPKLPSPNHRISDSRAFHPSSITAASSLSVIDVSTVVERLNFEISQTAVFISNSFTFEDIRRYPTPERLAAYDRVKGDFGSRVPELLMSIPHDDDVTLVRIAIQTCFVWYCKHIIGAFAFNEKMLADRFLWRLYERIRAEEDQTVFGVWRALTHKHVQLLLHKDTDLTSFLGQIVTKNLVDILIVSGCREDSSSVSSTLASLSSFTSRIDSITQSALRLNGILGQDFVSCDLSVEVIMSEGVFDQAVMDDMSQGYESKKVDRVLCTTGMGLKRVVKVLNEKGKEKKKRFRTEILLKPKIVVESVLESALGLK